MKYMIIRIKDEHSSKICDEIEKEILNSGGIKFPFKSIKSGKTYRKDDLEKGLDTSSYRTGLWHKHCRCHLVPISEETSKRIKNTKRWDILDEQLSMYGATSQVAKNQFSTEEEVTDEVKKRFMAGLKTFSTRKQLDYIKRTYKSTKDLITKAFRR